MVWYQPSVGGPRFEAIVASAPALLGGHTWVCRLAGLGKGYREYTKRDRDRVPAAALFALSRRGVVPQPEPKPSDHPSETWERDAMLGDVDRIRAERLKETDYRAKYEAMARAATELLDALEDHDLKSLAGTTPKQYMAIISRTDRAINEVRRLVGLPNIQPEGE